MRLELLSPDAGLQIINIANPSSPTSVGTYNTNGTAYGVAVRDDAAFIADGESGIKILRIVNPNSPTLRASLNTEDAQQVALYGDTLYVADGAGGLKSVDISNLSSPSLIDSFPCFNARDLVISGSYAYIADDQMTRVVDLRENSYMERSGFVLTSKHSNGVAASNYIWLADGNKLQVLKMHCNASPRIVPNSEDFNYYPIVGTSRADWEFTWRTEEWVDPDLTEITLHDVDLDPDCTSYDNITLTNNTGGVTYNIYPSKEGGYMHIFNYGGQDCETVCEYEFDIKCGLQDEDNMYTESNGIGFVIDVCLRN